MSMFLPDGPNQGQSPSGVADITPADPETTSTDIALMQRVFRAAMQNPNLIPDQFMSYLLDWIQTQRLVIPIGQVFGFSQFTATVASGSGVGAQTATAYFDIGPSTSQLSAGRYVILFGCQVGVTGGGPGIVSPAIGASTALDTDAALSTGGNDTAFWSVQKTLALPTSLKLQARLSGPGSISFDRNILIALKYSNL